MSHEERSMEKLRRAFASLEGGPPEGVKCPEVETIWQAIHCELPSDEAEAVVEHTAVCADCADEWRIAMRSETAARSSRALSQRYGFLAAAAVLMIVIIGGVVAVQQGLFREPAAPEYRETQTAVIRSLVPEDQPLARDRAVLRWTSLAEGARYSINVATQDLTSLASASSLTAPEFVIPQDALEGLAPGTTIVWSVEARLSDGRRVVSTAFINTIE